jgi:hypothetical protein
VVREEARVIGVKKGVRNPRPKGRDAAGLGEKTRTRMEKEESSRTAENAAARCIAVEAVGMTQATQEVRPPELMGGAPMQVDGAPALWPEPAPTGMVRTTPGFLQRGLVRPPRPRAKERVSSMQTRPLTARLGGRLNGLQGEFYFLRPGTRSVAGWVRTTEVSTGKTIWQA